jgi:hypothetical protein
MAPRDYQEFVAAVRERLPKLAGGQLRIAHLVLADPEGTACRGIAEAARMVAVREPSITRFANSLGLRGYPEIMKLCRSWLAERDRLARRADEGGRLPGGPLSGRWTRSAPTLCARTVFWTWTLSHGPRSCWPRRRVSTSSADGSPRRWRRFSH